MDGPYRSTAIPRYLCIVCYRSLSQYAGVCRTCGVERLDLSSPEVREQVRLEAEKRLQKRMYNEYSILALASGAVVAPAMWWLGGFAFIFVPPVTMAVARAYAAIKRNSAIATFASRRRRISAELGVDVQLDEVHDTFTGRQRSAPLPKDAQIANNADIDPGQLEMEPLLAWLGARLDD
ncbi:MAG: hypothetical protein ACHQ17_09780 [Polyangia bacterium]